MPNKDKTAIALVVDRSGSMSSMRSEAEGAINGFLDDQADQPGEATVRIDQFDNVYESVVKSTPVADVDNYKLEPRGMTALLDAIGRTVTDLERELAEYPRRQRPANVVVVVITDGYENSSQEWTKGSVKKLIETKTEQGWEFIFLAANQDAIVTGAEYGFKADQSLSYDSANVAAASASMSGTVSSYRSTGTMGSFTDEDRKKAKVDSSS